jgi:hypothetical protein
MRCSTFNGSTRRHVAMRGYKDAFLEASSSASCRLIKGRLLELTGLLLSMVVIDNNEIIYRRTVILRCSDCVWHACGSCCSSFWRLCCSSTASSSALRDCGRPPPPPGLTTAPCCQWCVAVRISTGTHFLRICRRRRICSPRPLCSPVAY